MIRAAEQILVVGDKSLVREALVSQLVRLGHPPHCISVHPPVEAATFVTLLKDKKPDLVCHIGLVCEPAGHAASTDPCAPVVHAPSPTSFIEAAANAGIARFVCVATPATALLCDRPVRTLEDATNRETGKSWSSQLDEVKLRCSALNALGLDFRSVRTCEVYGPYWPGRAPARMSRTQRFIENLLQQISDAQENGVARVIVKTNPAGRHELMYASDAADAIVQIMELPRSELAAVTPGPSLHVDVGGETDFQESELIRAVASAAGFQGGVVLETTSPMLAGEQLDSRVMAQLDWRPLIGWQVGLELTAMDHRLRRMSKKSCDSPSRSMH